MNSVCHKPSTINYKLFCEAKRYIAGGVNSPVRAFRAVGGAPVFIERANGSKIYSADGKKYIDYVCSWGALILGHAHPAVVKAAKGALERGSSYGAPTRRETELAKRITKAIPSIELTRLVNSGTEAVMSAVRLARGATGKNKIIKFAGCYHGHADYLLVKAGSGAATFGAPDSAGVPRDFAKHTIVVEYNDIEAVERAAHKNKDDLAAIIVEPVAANMGVVLPEEAFLKGLRSISDKYKAILIFDEVITGFRLGYCGAQDLYGVTPDLTCLGKIVGGGFPLAAYGGRKDLMNKVSPLGSVYQAGTLSGNPVAVAAGIATLDILKETKPYSKIDAAADRICEKVLEAAAKNGYALSINKAGSLFTIFFTSKKVRDYNSARASDLNRFGRFFHSALDKGIYLPPSQFEATFVSAAHTRGDIDFSVKKLCDSLK